MEKLNLSFEGSNIHYYEWGKNHKPTIVCLHGLGNSGGAFFELAESLEEYYHIFAFDHPGHGKTSPFDNEENYLFSNIAKWYDNVFQQVIEEPFLILGHSWGADIALHYAKQYPEKIKGIILLDGGFTFPTFQKSTSFSKSYKEWDDYIDHCSVFDTWEDVSREYKRYTKRWNEKVERMVSTLFNKNDKYELISSKFTVLSIIKAFFKESFITTYPFLKSPLLLIHATLPRELDDARKMGILQIRKHVEDVKIVSMMETNHMVHWEHPEEIAKEIHNWITK